MGPRFPVVLLGVLGAMLGACLRPGEAAKAPAAGETRVYLRNVGQVRALVNAANRDQLPVLIRTQDQARLTAEAARFGEEARTLAALPTDRVDPDALRFTRNFTAILEGYRSACRDAAGLFRNLQEEQGRQTDPLLRPPEIRFDPAADPRDTIGTLNLLLDYLGRASPSALNRWSFLAPSIQKVRRDRDDLRLAKETHHDFALKLRPELARRYPGTDWTSKDILP